MDKLFETKISKSHYQTLYAYMSKSKYIETPEKLLDLFNDYRKHVKANPNIKADWVGKDATEVERKLEIPLTWDGFECYLSEKKVINDLGDYEANTDNAYSEYVEVIKLIKKFTGVDQFNGAAIGIFNANLMSRKLGLADKQEVKVDTFDITLNLK